MAGCPGLRRLNPVAIAVLGLAAVIAVSFMVLQAAWAATPPRFEEVDDGCGAVFQMSISQEQEGRLARFQDLLKVVEDTNLKPKNKIIQLKVLNAPTHGFLKNWTLHIRAHSTDEMVVSGALCANAFAPVVAFLREKAPPKTIVDLGGNTGLVTLYLAASFPNANIVVLEPGLSNFLTLRLNTLGEPNIRAELAAVSDAVGSVQLHQADDFDGESYIGMMFQKTSKTYGGSPSDFVPSYSVEHIMQLHKLDHIDFLKVDVEGSEKDMFADPARYMRWLPKVTCLSLELHDRMVPNCSTTAHAAMARGGFTRMHMHLEDDLELWCRGLR